MKQKAVFKVPHGDLKKQSKALKVAVGFPGVTKVEVQGDDKSKLAVEGDDIDVTALTKSLRKKLGGNGSVELLTFQPADKDKDKDEKKKIEELFYAGYLPVHPQPGYWVPPYATPAHPYYAQQMYPEPYSDDTSRCSIM